MNGSLVAASLGLPILAATVLSVVCFSSAQHRATGINSPGSYEAGSYFLSNDIAISHGNGLIFTGTATLDLRGHRLSTTRPGNAWDIGVTLEGENSRLYDSGRGKGQITGFRVGVQVTGEGSKVIGIDFTGNRYIGAWIRADNVEIRGGAVGKISGVTDEKYAIGVQVGTANNCMVDGVSFEEMYPQGGYLGDGAGEGLPVNFSATATNCTLRNSVAINKMPRSDTIGVFAGEGGGHVIQGNIIHNFSIGLASASTAKTAISGNLVSIDALVPGSIGISGETAIAKGNVITGPYETAIEVGTEGWNQVVIEPLE